MTLGQLIRCFRARRRWRNDESGGPTERGSNSFLDFLIIENIAKPLIHSCTAGRFSLEGASLTTIAAWWGAVIATLLLLWDVYKWARSGARLRVSANANMELFGVYPVATPDHSYIFVEAVNTGKQPTTITHFVARHYSSLIWQLLRKPSSNFFIPNNAFGSSVPHVLAPGERWTGGVDQTNYEERFGRKGRLFVGVYHSLAKGPVLKRVVL